MARKLVVVCVFAADVIGGLTSVATARLSLATLEFVAIHVAASAPGRLLAVQGQEGALTNKRSG